MDAEGPPLELLTQRLAETPEDFLGEPRVESTGTIQVAAVAGDLARLLGNAFTAVDLDVLQRHPAPVQRVALLLCWLLADEWFSQHPSPFGQVSLLLLRESAELATQTAAAKFVSHPERREELARLTLARLGWRPAGETIAQAQDRLTSLSAVERARVREASRAAEARARSIREALARKAAEESADKWTRE